MLMLPDVKVYLSTSPTDMRKSFDGLAQLGKQELSKDVFTGELFVFINRSVNRVKILYWDRNGYCLWAKRLEKGIFRRPKVQGKAAPMRINELSLLLEGIDLTYPQRLVVI
ncbi:MAG: IS66 family insertion sequence element accessory protein TnpB [Proteobacteria bacterium]|nr:IS66 family insertion sequence element accessory protein TnpB [Pseudomonadota bacterium]